MPEPIRYMERSRRYYSARGFERAYEWANFERIPFAVPRKPLADSRLALITTAATYPRQATDARAVDTGSTSELSPRLYANDLFWHKKATHLEDPGSYFPLRQLREAMARGRLGSISPRFYCAPTSYSQRETSEVDAPEILSLCREDGVDAALLVPL